MQPTKEISGEAVSAVHTAAVVQDIQPFVLRAMVMTGSNSDEGNAIFIRGLARNVTGEQLESFFSGVGPIRRSFVVTDGTSSSHCTGLGFVHFALREDAAKALQVFQGASLSGRRLKLDFARRRQRGSEVIESDGGLRVKGSDSRAHNKKTRGKLSGSEASCTVVVRTRISGATLNSNAVMNKLSKDPSKAGFLSSALSADGTSMRLLFRSWPEAGAAASQIHCRDFEACVDALSGGRKCKLIVRNLPFKICPAELRSVFEKVAKVRDISIPLSTKSLSIDQRKKNETPSEEEAVNSRGFAFVEYFLAADANRAIEIINGAKIGGRTIAVDLAIGKSEFVEKSAAGESDEKDIAEEKVGGKVDPVSSGTRSYEEDSIAEKLPGKVEKKAESTPEEMKRTVFVRNLLFETTAFDLRMAMVSRFGPVEQVVIVKDPMTGRPRGTAFVRFKNVEDAEAVVNTTPESDNSQGKTAFRNQWTFSLQGRDLLITRAVNRDRARDLVVGPNGKKDRPDRRNMRLAWIGHIKPDSPEGRHLTEADLGKRAKAAKEKKAKLSSNPNAFVSDTRLCVRNLPKSVDEKFLKHMALAVLRSESNQYGVPSTENPVSRPKVLHSKVVRDPNRKERSRGFGFLQFEEHRHALQALHKLNNNPKLIEMLIEMKPKVLEIDDAKAKNMRQDWGKNRRLIVEFSVEDSRQVAVLNRIKEKGKAMKEVAKAEEEEKLKEFEAKGLKKKTKKQNPRWFEAKQSTITERENEPGKGQKRRLNETMRHKEGREELQQPQRKRSKTKTKLTKEDRFDNLVSDYKRRLVNK